VKTKPNKKPTTTSMTLVGQTTTTLEGVTSTLPSVADTTDVHTQVICYENGTCIDVPTDTDFDALGLLVVGALIVSGVVVVYVKDKKGS